MTKGLVHLWLVGILGLASDSSAECARAYRYSFYGELNADILTIHVPDAATNWGAISPSSDVSTTIEFCGSDSEYFCIIPLFAVPRNFDGSVRKWTVRDTTYEVVREGVMVQLLGRRIGGLYEIRASPLEGTAGTEKPRDYLYSPSSGLIRFTTPTGAVAWLMDDVGFGASEPEPAPYPSIYRSRNRCPAAPPS